MSHSPASARRCAIHLLHQVLDKKHPLDAAFGSDRNIAALSPQDRAFTQLLVKTALRRLGQIDAIIHPFLERPLPETAQMAYHILRLGAAQLLFMDTPAYAVVNSFVEESKTLSISKYSGLINAVLKRIDKEGHALLAAQDAPLLNTPVWLWESWVSAYGEEKTRAIASAHMQDPPLDISVKKDAAAWAKELGGELLEGGSIRLQDAGNITELPGFEEGAWWVQDAAASMPVRMLAEAMGPLKNKTTLDMCAAPGGKTLQLAAAGAKVTALDISESRLRLVEENLKRTKLKATCIASDAAKWQSDELFDAILLDAPCSATGTLRRHPDVAWLRSPGDIARLSVAQHRLFCHALTLLKPGGLLAYAVCSLQPEESVIPSQSEGHTLLSTHRTTPAEGMDGFFLSIFLKQ